MSHRRLNPASPFDALEASFRALTSPPAPLVLDGSAIPGLPARWMPLDEVRSRLLHPATAYPVRDGAIDTLLCEAQAHGGAALVGLAGVLLPGLRTAAWPLTQACPGKAADIEVEMLAGLVLAVRDARPGRARPAARLTWAARRAGEELVRSERVERARPVPLRAGAEPPRPAGHPDLVLAQAVAEGVLCAADAELIGGTRLGEYDLHTAALAAGVTYRAIRERRRRAEAAVLAWLRKIYCPEFVANGGQNPGSSHRGRPRQDPASRPSVEGAPTDHHA
ncbi:MAG: hypothetical protein ACYDAQ_19095 [Mycobacteriales bacterium]